jgi:hypothetical protein
MRIIKSQDGTPRFTLKIETRVSAYDMAVHLINRLQYEEGMSAHHRDDETTEMRDVRLENNIKALMSGMTQSQIMNKVRDSILFGGQENPHYAVGDSGYSVAVDFLTGYLTRKYRGFSAI